VSVSTDSASGSRFQRGSLRLEGERWILRARGDGIDPATGRSRRIARRVMLGTRAQLPSIAAARRAADKLAWQLNPIDRAGRLIAIADFADIYLADAVPMMKRTSGASVRAIARKHIRPFFKGKRMDELTGRLPQQFVAHLVRAKLKRKTIRNVIAVLSRMLDLARQYGYQAEKLDRKLIKLPPDEIDTRARCFTPEEARRILEAAQGQWRACFALMAHLGLRAGEALGLTWSHIDFAAGLVLVRQAAVMGSIQTVKSRNSKADLPMSDGLRYLLENFRAAVRQSRCTLLVEQRSALSLPPAARALRHSARRPARLPARACNEPLRLRSERAHRQGHAPTRRYQGHVGLHPHGLERAARRG
jgi:integrase